MAIPGRQLIIVDIQPAYESDCKYFMSDLIQELAEYEGNVLYLYNGPEMGFESEGEIIDWLIDQATEILGGEEYNEETDEYIPNENLERFRDRVNEFYFIEKGYGFIRDTLDSGFQNETLEIVRYLIANDLTDARDIDEEELINLNLPEELTENLTDGGWSIALPAFNYNILRRWSGATLIGGGRDECLLEVEIIMQAMNVPYNLDNKFIY